MALAVDTLWFYNILQLILYIDFHGHDLLARFAAYNFHLSFHHSLRSVLAFSQLLLYIFLLSPFDIAGLSIYRRQTRPLAREDAPEKQDLDCQRVINIWS
jgi:hypothetical protein